MSALSNPLEVGIVARERAFVPRGFARSPAGLGRGGHEVAPFTAAIGTYLDLSMPRCPGCLRALHHRLGDLW